MKYNFLLQEIKLFLSRISWKKGLTFLFFLILAIIFWCIQVYSRKINITKNITLKYVNVNDSLVFEAPPTTNIEVRLKDYGSTLLQYLKLHDDTIVINMNAFYSIYKNGYILQGNELENLIKNKLLPSSELIGTFPNSISLNYHKADLKKVPIIFDGYINIPIGYQLEGDITIKPDSILLAGSKQKLDSINYVYTYQDTISDLKSDKHVTLDIIPIKGIKMTPNKVELDIPINEFVKKTLMIPIECINLPKNLSIKFFPSEINISFFVSLNRSKYIHKSDFRIIVNYRDIQNSPEMNTVPISLLDMPDFIRIQQIDPNEVEFILEEIQDQTK